MSNQYHKSDWFYCQSDVEGRGICDKQCDHCAVPYRKAKEPSAPLPEHGSAEELWDRYSMLTGESPEALDTFVDKEVMLKEDFKKAFQAYASSKEDMTAMLNSKGEDDYGLYEADAENDAKLVKILGAENETLKKELTSSKQRINQLEDALRKDKTGLAAALAEINKTLDGYRWVTEGRGPYAWNDDRYKTEMLIMLETFGNIATKGLRESGKLATNSLHATADAQSVEAGTTNPSPLQPGEQLYRFVKASERLPNDPEKEFIVLITHPLNPHWSELKRAAKHAIRWYYQQSYSIEWLEPVSLQSLIEELRERNPYPENSLLSNVRAAYTGYRDACDELERIVSNNQK